MGQCGIEIVNFGLWTFAPQISTPRFTDPQIQVWYIQGKDVQLKFRDAVLKPKFDWAKAMMAAAPDLPEYVYAYINTRKGPAPEKALNPPFFVEKDRVNFFIIPQNDETEEPSSEEEKKPSKTKLKPLPPNNRLISSFGWTSHANPAISIGVRTRSSRRTRRSAFRGSRWF